MNAASVELDYKHGVVGHQPARGPDLGREEIRSEQRAPVSAQKCAPRHWPLTARRNALFPQDLRDRRAANSMAKVLERTLDPRVAPARIVVRHPNRETTDLRLHARSPGPRRRVR